MRRLLAQLFPPATPPTFSVQDMSRSRAAQFQPDLKRILMICDRLNRGGAERQLFATAVGLARQGYDVRILALWPHDDAKLSLVREINSSGIKYDLRSDILRSSSCYSRGWIDQRLGNYFETLPQWLVEFVAPIANVIVDWRPAVVHGWLDTPSVIAAIPSIALGVPRIVIGQRNLSPPKLSHTMPDFLIEMYRAIAAHPNVVLTNNSAAGASDYEQWLGSSAGAIKVVRNGFAPESVETPHAHKVTRFRAKHAWLADTPVVGSIMNFVPTKDPLLFLNTAARIAAARSDVRFLLVGDGVLIGEVKEHIEALRLTDKVALYGPVVDVGLIFASIDVFLSTSQVEGTPNVLIEAQATGRPVVAPDVGGISETVFNGLTGRVVSDRSADKLAQVVIDILANPEWKHRARLEGPAFVARRFGIERMIDETIDTYDLL
jgi:glycosyltransferase involved in cell wall biosynthesis